MDIVVREGLAKLFLHLLNINEDWEQLPDCGNLKHFKKGKMIPASAENFYLLKSGIIRAVVTTAAGQDWTLLYQEKGCIFNELGALQGGIEQLYYLCQTDVSVYCFPGELLLSEEFYRRSPEKAINLITTLAVKEAISYAYTTDVACADAMGRVCQSLLALVNENQNKDVFSPDVTQSEIASMMGLHQTTVARAIKELRAKKIIGKFTKKRLEVLDREKLVQIARGGKQGEELLLGRVHDN